MKDSAVPALLAPALAWHDAGWCVVPIKADGSKSPAVAWKDYGTGTMTTRAQVSEWFSDERYGVGVVMGDASGGGMMLELEARAVAAGAPQRLVSIAQDNGLDALLTRVMQGAWARSPSGGMHLYIRTEGATPRNQKLATRVGADGVEVIAETRGQGGQAVVPPTPGRFHPLGGTGWGWIRGGPGTAAVLTGEDTEAILILLSALDEPPPAAAPQRFSSPTPKGDSDGPGVADDFNARTTWAEILGPSGWIMLRTLGSVSYWRRPGKDDPGISATTGRNESDNLYVFSTSAGLPTEKAMSRFRVYAHLRHGGNESAAAKALYAEGYGKRPTTPPELPARPLSLVHSAPAAPPTTVGNTALALRPVPRTIRESEDANVNLLVSSYSHRLRYCPERGRWLAWDDRRWVWQAANHGAAVEAARVLARVLPEESKPELAHKIRSLSGRGILSVVGIAAADPRMAVSLSDLDADPWALNTPAGVVDLRTGLLTPPDPNQLHTRATACAPGDYITDGAWATFLTQTFGGDQTLIDYVRRLVGYSATGQVRAHILPFAQGPGGAGKGSFLEAVRGVLGDYATTAPAGFLMGQRFGQHETEIARLAGARFVLCSEVNEDDHFDEQRVKQLTGGDTLTARFMRQDHFSFVPTHHLWLMGNNQPAVRNGGHAFWRRLRLIPFSRIVPEDQIVDDLQGTFARDCGPEVLAWIIAGAAECYRDGLGEPPSVKVATAGYEHDQDSVGRFTEDLCLMTAPETPGYMVPVARVRGAYEKWCSEAGEQPVSAKALTMSLRSRFGVVSTKGANGVRHYDGLHLVIADQTEVEPWQNR
jgi:putative DNA primase/helicase